MVSHSCPRFSGNGKIGSTGQRAAAGGRRARLRWSVLLCALAGGGAWAADDALHPYVSLAYNHDDNLFRLPDNSPGYDGQRDDMMRTIEAGLLFNKTYGRQELLLDAKVNSVDFAHFKDLGYNGKDVRGEWGWHLGNHLQGQAGAHYVEVLAPYTDVATRERNVRKQTIEYLNGGWSVHPSWRLRAGATHSRYTYELAALALSNRTDTLGEVGVDYLAFSGSTIGLQARKLRIRYDSLRSAGGQLVDPNSDQDDLKLKVLWKVTGISDVEFLGGWARRTHAFFAERDSSGANARLTARSQLGGKWGFNGAVWREYSGVESNIVSYSLNTGASAAATWTASAKLQFNLQSRYEKRQFKGLLASAVGFALDDATRNNSVGVTYVPWNRVQLSSSLYREARAGVPVLGNGNYHATGLSLNVNLQY